LKHHKTWFDSQFLGQLKHPKMQLLQKSNGSNVDNLIDVRHDGFDWWGGGGGGGYLKSEFNIAEFCIWVSMNFRKVTRLVLK
jgi:hypothetical protein